MILVGLALTFSSVDARASDPEPENASILGATATLLPIAVGGALLLTGRRYKEGVRLASGLTTISLGAALGPYAGQLYAGGGSDALVTLGLRTVTTGLFTTGLTLRLRGGSEKRDLSYGLMVLGGIPALLLAGYDIFKAADTARESRIRVIGQGPLEGELYSVAVCGPIPCARGLERAPEATF